MNRSKKLILIVISILMILSVFVGCSARKTESSRDNGGVAVAPSAPMPSPSPGMPSEEKGLDNDFGGGVTSPLEPSKVITTVYLKFETLEFEKSNEELNELIAKYQAYVEYSNISYNQYYNAKNYRNGEFVIRVPREKIQSFKTELNLIGNLTSENTNKQDVTKEYTDTESRLKVIEVKEGRILALLEKAEKIEDIIALENQLSNTILEKESLKSNLLTIDDKVDFSTVSVSIQEVEKTTNTETVATTFGTKVKNAINDSIFFFKDTLQGLVILLIYLFPFLIIVAVLLFIVIRFLKKYKKNKPE